MLSSLVACLEMLVPLAKPLRVGVGAIEVVARFVQFELAGFRSFCRFCQKSCNLGRVQRMKTAGCLESLLENRKRIAAGDDDAGWQIHRVVEAFHGGGGFTLKNKVVAHRLHTEHAAIVLEQDRQDFFLETVVVRIHYVERHLNGIECEAVL